MDLTTKERENNRKLRAELRKKKEKGENGWIISNPKLIRRNF